MPTTPHASVIIAAWNGETTIGEQLTALVGQRDAPTFEVLVMDNGSTDGTRSVSESFADRLDLRVIPATEHRGQCYARNTGVLHARGTHVLICDQDDVVGDTWVAALSAALDEEDVLATGPMDFGTLNDPEVADLDTAPGEPNLVPPFVVQGYLPFVHGCNMGLRRATYLRLRGMDNSYRGGDEDTEFSWRAQESGVPIACVDGAVVQYRLRTTEKRLFHQRRGYGRTRVLTWVRTRDTRPLSGMSLAWTLRETAKLPFSFVATTRASQRARFAWARQAGAVVGNLEGQVRYRLLGRMPRPQLLDDAAIERTSR